MYRVCGVHFEEEMYTKCSIGKNIRRLKSDSIPTLKLPSIQAPTGTVYARFTQGFTASEFKIARVYGTRGI